jgi:methionine sulfoxide reductase heme-binding subunit
MPVPFKILKPAAFLLCIAPLAYLIWRIIYRQDSFSANPFGDIRDFTGDWTLRFILITLAITPLRQISGWNAAARFRRMMGLFAFFYGSLHFVTYLWFNVFFDVGKIVDDVAKRPFITVGFAAFVLMIPLAVTSTTKWISRLGGKRWQRLHQAVYITGILGVIHYIWRLKTNIRNPLIYGLLLALLLGYRVWKKFRTPAVIR